jgi:hypothetical protein
MTTDPFPLAPRERLTEEETRRQLALALDQVRASMGPLAETVLPAGTTLTGIQTEAYRSPELSAALDVEPGQYPVSDRSVISLALLDGRQIFMVAGRVGSRFHMADGVDYRRVNRAVYEYDGAGTITEYTEDGRANTYTGEHGDPDVLLSYARRDLGQLLGIEGLGKPLQAETE